MIILFFVVYSCFRNVIWDAGDEETRQEALSEYHYLDIRSIFDVILVQDTVCFIKITCGTNLIDRVKVSQKSDTLELKEMTDMNWTRSYRRTLIELHFNRLRHIHIEKGVNITSAIPIISPLFSIWDDSDLSELDLLLDCTDFKLSVSEDNFGIFTIHGKTKSSCLELDGAAHFRTEQLQADSCYIEHKGIGDCYVNAQRVVQGKIFENGRLYYKFYPGISVNVENLHGRLIPLND